MINKLIVTITKFWNLAGSQQSLLDPSLDSSTRHSVVNGYTFIAK